MAKDPAFLFYSSDFLSGCIDLDMEERGQYITLLCAQHQKGHLSEKTIRLLLGSVSVCVLAKFQKDEHGLYFSPRLDIEIEKRKNFTETRKKNGSKGGRPKKETETEPSAKPLGYPSDNLIENENENENKDVKLKVQSEIKMPYDDSFLVVWDRWKEYKKTEHRFKYKSDVSEQAALIELSKLATDQKNAEEIIMQSIANGWKGFFKLKDNGNSNSNNRGKGYSTDLTPEKAVEWLNTPVFGHPRKLE